MVVDSEQLKLRYLAQSLSEQVVKLQKEKKELIQRIITLDTNYEAQKKSINEKFEENAKAQERQFELLQLKYSEELDTIKLENEELKKRNLELTKMVDRLTNENNYLKKQLTKLKKTSEETATRLDDTIRLMAKAQLAHQTEMANVNQRLQIVSQQLAKETTNNDDTMYMNMVTDVFRYIRDYAMLKARQGGEADTFKSGSSIIEMLNRLDSTLTDDEKRIKSIATDIVENRLSLSSETLIQLQTRDQGRVGIVHALDRRHFHEPTYVLPKFKELLNTLDTVQKHHSIYPDAPAIKAMLQSLIKGLDTTK